MQVTFCKKLSGQGCYFSLCNWFKETSRQSHEYNNLFYSYPKKYRTICSPYENDLLFDLYS